MPSTHFSKIGSSSWGYSSKTRQILCKAGSNHIHDFCFILFACSQFVATVRRIKLSTNPRKATHLTISTFLSLFVQSITEPATHLLLEGRWMLLKVPGIRQGLQTTKLINSNINFSVSRLTCLPSKNTKVTHNVDISLRVATSNSVDRFRRNLIFEVYIETVACIYSWLLSVRHL